MQQVTRVEVGVSLHVVCLYTLASGMQIPNWDFGGATVVTGNYVRLTPDRQSKHGSLWNAVVNACMRSSLPFVVSATRVHATCCIFCVLWVVYSFRIMKADPLSHDIIRLRIYTFWLFHN